MPSRNRRRAIARPIPPLRAAPVTMATRESTSMLESAPLQEPGGGHREDQDRALDNQLPERCDTEDGEAIFDHAQEQNADDRAQYMKGSWSQRRGADEGCREQIGRASCRESVSVSGAGGALG